MLLVRSSPCTPPVLLPNADSVGNAVPVSVEPSDDDESPVSSVDPSDDDESTLAGESEVMNHLSVSESDQHLYDESR